MSKFYIEPSKRLKVFGEYDVIVVGGGCAGFASAVSAGRNGAKTLIIERFPYFGGTATASLMAKINGFRNQVEPDSLQTTKGIGEEVILRLKDIGGLGKKFYRDMKEYPTTKGNLSFSYVIDIEKFKYVTLKMVLEAKVDILFHTYFSDVIKEGDRVKGVIFENKSGRQCAFGKVIIDATGDGDVAYRAGADFWQIKESESSRLLDQLMYKITGFQGSDDLPGCQIDEYTMILWGPTAGPIDATDALELTKAEIKTRIGVFEYLEEMKKKYPSLNSAKVIETGPLLGIKQTRFIKGLYKLTAEDVIEGRTFDDSIAMGSKPIISYYGYRRYLEHEGYEIPYRCLIPESILGLLIAGRCISSDQPAFESWRSMATIMAIGEAAGTAGALASRYNIEPREMPIKLLQDQLIKQGAEIGQNNPRRKEAYENSRRSNLHNQR